jgi:hypothetical protein
VATDGKGRVIVNPVESLGAYEIYRIAKFLASLVNNK